MSYREARSLQILLVTVNQHAPNRSRVSDGWIGDAAHASRNSDHNPWVKDVRGVGVVRARDFTHDPAGGLDCHDLARRLAALLHKHPALGSDAYVIWNRRIISANRLREGWRPYSGANPHTKHLHVSVGTSGYDSTKPWPLWRVERAVTRLKELRKELREVLRAAKTKGKTRRVNKIREGLRDLPKR
ncbi:hypothetical protein ACJ5H2_13635 [Nocardioides sp. R1-1]|uniref:hypothetical protein n=1 Tax=Nocardioides sp. R1-1 TaxID=3383502 RepID=UPI0038D08A8C